MHLLMNHSELILSQLEISSQPGYDHFNSHLHSSKSMSICTFQLLIPLTRLIGSAPCLYFRSGHFLDFVYLSICSIIRNIQTTEHIYHLSVWPLSTHSCKLIKGTKSLITKSINLISLYYSMILSLNCSSMYIIKPTLINMPRWRNNSSLKFYYRCQVAYAHTS